MSSLPRLNDYYTFFVEMMALKISKKLRTIKNVTYKWMRPYVLEECAKTYNCDGYGNPLS